MSTDTAPVVTRLFASIRRQSQPTLIALPLLRLRTYGGDLSLYRISVLKSRTVGSMLFLGGTLTTEILGRCNRESRVSQHLARQLPCMLVCPMEICLQRSRNLLCLRVRRSSGLRGTDRRYPALPFDCQCQGDQRQMGSCPVLGLRGSQAQLRPCRPGRRRIPRRAGMSSCTWTQAPS